MSATGSLAVISLVFWEMRRRRRAGTLTRGTVTVLEGRLKRSKATVIAGPRKQGGGHTSTLTLPSSYSAVERLNPTIHPAMAA
ncbi:hypothetical protein J4Q44_G00121340 [Coregonus suidteri]|uniref:Uncharacterized protein n=1 Tax=Coregonus suidteri TaxID=861788 RepID=A0AAN8LW44_9TELE